MKKLVIFLLTLALTVSLAACGENPSGPAESSAPSQPADETAQTLTLDGTDLEGAELPDDLLAQGGITLVNGWGTVCNPYLEEMPHLEELYQEYTEAGKSFNVIGVVADVSDDKGTIYQGQIDHAKEIVDQLGITFLNVIPGEIFQANTLSETYSIATTLIPASPGQGVRTMKGSILEAVQPVTAPHRPMCLILPASHAAASVRLNCQTKYPCRFYRSVPLLNSPVQSSSLWVTSHGCRLRRWNRTGAPSWNRSASRMA